MATPTFRTATNLAQGAATSIVLNKPSGTTSGDVLYATISTFSNVTPTGPSGWIQLGTRFVGSTIWVTFWRKVAGGGEPSTYTWTFSSAVCNGSIYRWDGVDNTTPEDATNQTSGSSATISMGSVTPTVSGGIQLALMSNTHGPYDSAPSGWTQDDTDGGQSNGEDHRNATLTSGTPSGAGSQTLPVSSEWACYTIALTPTSSGGSPQPPARSSHGQWPIGPLRFLSRQALTPKDPHLFGNTMSNAATIAANEMFFGEADPAITRDAPVVSKNYGSWPLGPLRITQRLALTQKPRLNPDQLSHTITGGSNEDDLTRGLADLFFGQVDQLNTPWIGQATGQSTTTDNALSNGEVSGQETYAGTAQAVTLVPGAATGQYTYTGNALSNGEVGGQETSSGGALGSGEAGGQYIYNGTATAVTIVPGAATGQETYTGNVLSNGEVRGQSTSAGATLSNGEVGAQYIYTGSATVGNQLNGSASGQYTYNGAVLSCAAVVSFMLYAGLATAVLATGQLTSPRATVTQGGLVAGVALAQPGAAVALSQVQASVVQSGPGASVVSGSPSATVEQE